MAIMTLLLSEYANEEIDVLRVISMLLIHDLVEIDAGDTYAYDEEGKQTQRAREVKAADRIYGILPEDQGKKLRELWEEFEEAQTPEAKFAHVMDNVQPAMLNAHTEGKDWIAKGVRLSQILERNAHTAEGSQKLWDYAFTNFIEPNVRLKMTQSRYYQNINDHNMPYRLTDIWNAEAFLNYSLYGILVYHFESR